MAEREAASPPPPRPHKKIDGYLYHPNGCMIEQEVEGIKVVKCIQCHANLKSRSNRDNSVEYRNLTNHFKKHL